MTYPRRSSLRFASLLLLCLLPLGACGGDDPGADRPARDVEFDFTPGGPIPDAELAEFHVALECSVARDSDGEMVFVGAMTFTLWPEAAPRAVRRFLRHCAEGDYDGTPFHRILREFVVQGGDPTGKGFATSPYGNLQPEVTADPRHAHGYGVLALTAPPSLQYYVCVAESPQVWSLDEQPISRIGRLTGGVAALEQVANVQVGFLVSGAERSAPVKLARVDRAHVVRGPAPTDEAIRRPQPDLQGEPEVVVVEHILVTFTERGAAYGVNRNRLEAQALANECLGRIQSGELGWNEAVLEYNDFPLHPGASLPVRRISNFGVLRLDAQRARLDAQRELNAYRQELRLLLARAEISSVELARRQEEHGAEVAARVAAIAMERREDIDETAYSTVAFGLEPGEVGLVEYDPYTSHSGWYIVRRIE